jgi:phage gp36-like protein
VPYVAEEGLRAAYLQLVGGEEPEYERLDAARATADLTVARYLGGRNVAAEVVAGVALDLALYDLCGQSFTDNHPVYARWKAALSWLEGVAQGRITPPEEAATDVLDTGQARAEAPDRVWTAGTLQGF